MKRSLTRFVFALATLTAMQAWAISPDDVKTTEIRKLVDIKQLKSVKGATRIAVPGYRVIFTTRTKVVANAEDWLGGVGGGRSSGARASMEVVLGNVDFPLLQSITDQAYADFLKQLEATGLEVLTPDAIKSSAAFAKMKIAGSSEAKPYTKKSRDSKTHYLVVSPSAIPLWFTNWDGDISDQGMSQTNMKALFEMARELDATLVYPIMHVDFASVGGSGGKFARRASVSAKAAVYVNPAYTLFYVANGKGGSSFSRISDSIGVEGDPGEFVKADQASNEAFIGSMQKIGIDFGPVRSKKNMVLQANRENFQSLALEALGGSNSALRRGLEEAAK
jgi:hypothetical protein